MMWQDDKYYRDGRQVGSIDLYLIGCDGCLAKAGDKSREFIADYDRGFDYDVGKYRWVVEARRWVEENA